MGRKRQYNHKIRIASLLRVIAVAGLLLYASVSFVLIRNEHVLLGNEIRELEEEISDMRHESEMWELRIAAVRDRSELVRRLRWSQSTLQPIDPQRVIEIPLAREARSVKPLTP